MKWLTEGLITTYRKCNAQFQYKPGITIPRRVLTNPSVPCGNNGLDNERADLILHVGDVLTSDITKSLITAAATATTEAEPPARYTVVDMLGQGTFGQVFKCRDEERGVLVAVKVLKNKPSYFKQGLLEVGVLTAVNTNCDPEKRRHTLRLLDHFLCHGHLCVVNELLSMSLFEFLRRGGFRGVSVRLARAFLRQILVGLAALGREGIVHCDLKPENILLDRPSDIRLTVIDFGSACFEATSPLYTYVQSRHYRAPEVILGLRYTCAIDMWSLGCVAAELLLGVPLFPGVNEHDQLYKITSMLGQPPPAMIAAGLRSRKFYTQDGIPIAPPQTSAPLQMKAQQNSAAAASAVASEAWKLPESLEELVKQKCGGGGGGGGDTAAALLDFLRRALEIDPTQRMTAEEGLRHPFITGKPSPDVPLKQQHEKGSQSACYVGNVEKEYARIKGPTAENYEAFCQGIYCEHKVLDVSTGETLFVLGNDVRPHKEGYNNGSSGKGGSRYDERRLLAKVGHKKSFSVLSSMLSTSGIPQFPIDSKACSGSSADGDNNGSKDVEAVLAFWRGGSSSNECSVSFGHPARPADVDNSNAATAAASDEFGEKAKRRSSLGVQNPFSLYLVQAMSEAAKIDK